MFPVDRETLLELLAPWQQSPGPRLGQAGSATISVASLPGGLVLFTASPHVSVSLSLYHRFVPTLQLSPSVGCFPWRIHKQVMNVLLRLTPVPGSGLQPGAGRERRKIN